jgi:hypothetical protein
MTPKYKAEELFNQYANIIYQRALTETQFEICKQCALIAVDEILNVALFYNDSQAEVIYWQEVKKEIQAL